MLQDYKILSTYFLGVRAMVAVRCGIVERFFFLTFVHRNRIRTYPHHMQKSNSMNFCGVLVAKARPKLKDLRRGRNVRAIAQTKEIHIKPLTHIQTFELISSRWKYPNNIYLAFYESVKHLIPCTCCRGFSKLLKKAPMAKFLPYQYMCAHNRTAAVHILYYIFYIFVSILFP